MFLSGHKLISACLFGQSVAIRKYNSNRVCFNDIGYSTMTPLPSAQFAIYPIIVIDLLVRMFLYLNVLLLLLCDNDLLRFLSLTLVNQPFGRLAREIWI